MKHCLPNDLQFLHRVYRRPLLRCCLLLLLTFSISDLFAQNTVTGRVTTGDTALAGVTVTVKGTKNATATNDRGEFSLTGVDENAILVFTGINVLSLHLRWRFGFC